MTLALARVAATHPEDNSVDLVMVDTGARLAGVQVLSQNASSRAGSVDLPVVDEPPGGKWSMERTGSDMIAVVGYIGRQPVVTGFLFPQVNQMLFKDPKLRVNRHQSDVYTSIDGDGNAQIVHPSGTHIRIGESADLQDLAGGDADGDFAVDRNTGRKVHVRVGMGGGTATLTIAPDGAVTLVTQQGVSIVAEADVSVKAPKVIADTALVHATGDIVADGDVIASGVSLVGHIHGGVERGGSSTSAPNR